MGGDIEVFFEGGVKFWEEKSRVQSPESRVQGPVQLLGYSGEFTYVADTNNLRGDMAACYDFFSTHKARNEPIISIRHIDAFGTVRN